MTTAINPVTSGFVASASLTSDLQAVLVALLELQNQAKQAHWALVGPQFRPVHLQLDEIVGEVREYVDTIAERLRALEAMPDGRTATIHATSTLEPFPAGEVSAARAAGIIADRVVAAVSVIRGVHDDVDNKDPTSADILHVVIEGLEKQRWMLTSQVRQLD
jgi:starvation-inducible DNA-binding protein